MSYTFEDRKAASEAGKMSRRGKSEKTKQWDKLGESILSGHSEKVNKELEKLEGAQFIDAYVSLLKYFKPTLRATNPDVEVLEVSEPYEPPRELSSMTNEQLIEELKLLDNG